MCLSLDGPSDALDISVERQLAAKGIPAAQEAVDAWRANVARLGLTEGEGFHMMPVYLVTRTGQHYRVWLSTKPDTYGAIERIETLGRPKKVSGHPWHSLMWKDPAWLTCERDAHEHHADEMAAALAERMRPVPFALAAE